MGLRGNLLLTGGSFAAIVAMAVIGSILHERGMLSDGSAAQIAARVIFLALVLIMVFSAIPLMVKLVLRDSNASALAIISWVLWALISLGLAIALPFAVSAGLFSPGRG